MPGISEAPKLKPWLRLKRRLGGEDCKDGVAAGEDVVVTLVPLERSGFEYRVRASSASKGIDGRASSDGNEQC